MRCGWPIAGCDLTAVTTGWEGGHGSVRQCVNENENPPSGSGGNNNQSSIVHIARKRNPSCIAQPSKTKVLRFMLIPAATLGDLQNEKPYIIGSNGHFCAISEQTPRLVQHVISVRVASSYGISLLNSCMVPPAFCSPS